MVFCFSRSFLRIFANEALGVVRVSASFALSNLRVRAQGTGSDYLAVPALRGHDLFGRDAFLDPFDQRGQKVALIRTDSAAAMSHSRDHKQPEEVRGRSPEAGAHFLVIIDAHHRVQRGVGPAVIHDYLTAARFEAAEIGVLRVEDAADRLELRRVSLEVK